MDKLQSKVMEILDVEHARPLNVLFDASILSQKELYGSIKTVVSVLAREKPTLMNQSPTNFIVDSTKQLSGGSCF